MPGIRTGSCSTRILEHNLKDQHWPFCYAVVCEWWGSTICMFVCQWAGASDQAGRHFLTIRFSAALGLWASGYCRLMSIFMAGWLVHCVLPLMTCNMVGASTLSVAVAIPGETFTFPFGLAWARSTRLSLVVPEVHCLNVVTACTIFCSCHAATATNLVVLTS